MPPTAKLIDQVTKNEDAIEEVEESDLPEPVKARVTKAIIETQKLAVDASAAWEGCKADLADSNAAKWKWTVLAGIMAAVGGFFIGRKF
jgi:hypothetical protein